MCNSGGPIADRLSRLGKEVAIHIIYAGDARFFMNEGVGDPKACLEPRVLLLDLSL